MSNIWSNEYNPFQKWKVLAWYDRLLGIKNGKFAAPVNIALDPIQGTSQKKICGQFKCNFCMSNFAKYDEKPAQIPTHVMLGLPRFFTRWGVKSLCIAGHHSDSTLYNQETMIEFLYLCKQYKLQVGFVTNGAYLTDNLIRALVDTCEWTGISMNAGTKETHKLITTTDTWDKIINNIKKMYEYQCKTNSRHTIGYKYLITDDNYMEILDGVKLASSIGVRHFQLRPAELPLERANKIDTNIVEQQMKEALSYQHNKFEVFGVREKFTVGFIKKTPCRCIASPLGSTWMADGTVVICPDRRWTANKYSLGNFLIEGPTAIMDKWGGPDHLKMIEEINKDIDNCIRCTAFSWHEIYENVIEEDRLNITLI
jgi:sulfatase maturation enzyme AslB (radical SAM superfamily)